MNPSAGASTIQEVRNLLGPVLPVWKSPLWHFRSTTLPRNDTVAAEIWGRRRTYYRCSLLLHRGRAVWGHVIKSFFAGYQLGKDNWWGVVIFSTDPYFDDHPDELVSVAAKLRDLRGTSPEGGKDLQRLAKLLDNDRAPLPRQFLPQELTDGRHIEISMMYFHRDHMPNGRLMRTLLPLIVRAKRSLPIILPVRYWPPLLIDAWNRASSDQPPEALYDSVLLPIPELINCPPNYPIRRRINAAYRALRGMQFGEFLKTIPPGTNVFVEPLPEQTEADLSQVEQSSHQIVLIEAPALGMTRRPIPFETHFVTTNGQTLIKRWNSPDEQPGAVHRAAFAVPLNVCQITTDTFL